MSRMDLCRAGVCALGLAAAAALGGVSCAGETEGADLAAEGSGEMTPESEEARLLVNGVREEFVRLPGLVELPLFAEELGALAQGPVLGPSAAEGFLREGPWLEPVLRDGAAREHGARVRLPATASGSFEVVDPRTGATVRARLLGAGDVPAEVAGGYLVYPGALPGMDVIQRPDSGGLEDHLRIEAPPAGASEIRYELELGDGVAGLRLVGGALEMIDASGAPRLRVAPPYLVDAAGRQQDAALALERCAVDTDPSPPWGRAPTEPGARSCELVVSWGQADYPILLDPNWATTDEMATARVYHEAVLLSSGDVLVVGGVTTGGAITDKAEIFDTATATWSNTDPMDDKRYAFGSTVVTYSGTENVVVAGGGSSTCSGGICTAAERWTSAGTWASAGTMSNARGAFPFTALTDGSNKALALGGLGSTVLHEVELYTPPSTWSTRAHMLKKRYGHTAAGLSTSYDSDVLVVGGRDETDAILSTTELYDLSADKWNYSGSMQVGRYAHTTTVISTDYILAVGGQWQPSACIRRVELWNPGTGTWSDKATLPGTGGKCRHAAARLESGDVVVMGGRTSPSASADTESQVYSVAGDSWSTADALDTARYGHSAVLYPVSGSNNDKVLAAGGIGPSSVLLSAELFTP